MAPSEGFCSWLGCRRCLAAVGGGGGARRLLSGIKSWSRCAPTSLTTGAGAQPGGGAGGGGGGGGGGGREGGNGDWFGSLCLLLLTHQCPGLLGLPRQCMLAGFPPRPKFYRQPPSRLINDAWPDYSGAHVVSYFGFGRQRMSHILNLLYTFKLAQMLPNLSLFAWF